MEGHRYGPLLPTRHDDDDDSRHADIMFVVTRGQHLALTLNAVASITAENCDNGSVLSEMILIDTLCCEKIGHRHCV